MAKAAKFPIPKNEVEATRLLSELEKISLSLDEQQVTLNKEVNNLITKANREAEATSEDFAKKFDALKAYATKEKPTLTDGGKRRSVTWTTGTLGWRNNPAGISVPRSTHDIARLIERILALRKPRFLRRKWELNIEAMEANPDEAAAIEGINKKAASEVFFIRFPSGTEIKQKIKLKAPSAKDLKEIS